MTPELTLVASVLAGVKACRLTTCGADLFHYCVALLGIHDAFLRSVFVFVSSHEQEPSRVGPHVFVVFEAQHHGFGAALVVALADERHALVNLEVMALGAPTQPLVCTTERGVVHRELASAGVILGRHRSAMP